jgi:outer membrane lipoprotein
MMASSLRHVMRRTARPRADDWPGGFQDARPVTTPRDRKGASWGVVIFSSAFLAGLRRSNVIRMRQAACASEIPPPISEAPAVAITLAQALAQADALKGRAVRWGGAIARIDNRKDETWIEIVEQPLSSDGEPALRDSSGGRFIAKVAGFLDPALYAPNRLMTVAGTLDGTATRSIGEYPYQYPVVKVGAYYLWPHPPRGVNHYYYPPYWYDPWYPWRYPYPYAPPPPPPPPRR